MAIQTYLKGGLLAASMLCALAAHAARKGPPGDIARQHGDIVYFIAQQETLSSIAQRFTGNVRNWQIIARANGITRDRSIPIGNSIVIPAALLPDRNAFATVVALRGAVNLLGAGGDLVDSRIGAQLTEGAVIVTGADGFVTFQLQDGTNFALPPTSNLQLTQLRIQDFTNRPRTALTLEKGRITSEVTPMTIPRSQFQVQTPLALAGVRGTRFRVNLDDGRNYSEVLHGAVGVTANTSTKAGRTNTTTRTLSANQGSVVGDDGQSAPVALLPAPQLNGTASLQQRLPLRVMLAQAGAARFRVGISTDAAGLRRVAEVTVAADAGAPVLARIAELDDGDYFIHASAIDSVGLEGNETASPLRLKARPFAPLLQEPQRKWRPADDAGTPLTFRWTEVGAIQRYRLQIARDMQFADRISDQTITGNTNWQQSGLVPGRYYWRVASITDQAGPDDQGPWTDVTPLDVLTPQAAPQASQGDDEMRFAWSGEAGQRFVFETAGTPDFGMPVQHLETAEPQVAFATPAPGTYYARVQSIDADGYHGAFSTPQKYVVEPRWRTGSGGSLNSSQGPVRAD